MSGRAAIFVPTRMADSPATLFFFGVITVCLIAITVALCATAWELRMTLRSGRRLLARAERVADQVGTVANRLSDGAAGIIGSFATIGKRVRNWFGVSVGNGAGADPRRRHRRR